MAKRPLDGIKVLDFTHVLAGPFATRVLGTLGADVVKVNSADRAVTSNQPDHPYYIMWNHNKRALALDMGNAQARDVCRQLCATADVVIDNFSVGVLDRWGVGYEVVAQTNPGVIYAQMSGMGVDGPWSDFVTYAPTIHAISGLTALTSVPGREDIGLGYSYNDHQSGLHGAIAILAALQHRNQTGRGQRIDISQFEVGVNFSGAALLDVFANDKEVHACANDLPYDRVAPHNVYRCAPAAVERLEDERWIAIACMNDAQWRALRGVLGNPEWSRQAQFDTAAGRWAVRAEIDARLAAWTAGRNDYELMTLLQGAGVPAGVVQNGIDLMERDPQLKDFVVKIDDVHAQIGATVADRLPIHFDTMPCDTYTRVRALGEDNAAVLADWLGMGADEVADGEARGVFK